jgi:hypothetical protein
MKEFQTLHNIEDDQVGIWYGFAYRETLDVL